MLQNAKTVEPAARSDMMIDNFMTATEGERWYYQKGLAMEVGLI